METRPVKFAWKETRCLEASQSASENDGSVPPDKLPTREGHVNVIEALISSGVSVDEQDEFGQSALRVAAVREDHTAVVRMLLDAGATMDNKNGARKMGVPMWSKCWSTWELLYI
uniref:Uncharacterized protein n=1 Tax=Globisporangium ultimum (strain ATCC 200006 / CBS 805.95 / DAOM BR144) TaxID=431595 RepID=K3WW98_GLOUD